MATRKFTIEDESFEVRALNTRALVLHEKSLLKQNIEKGSNEAGVELCRVLLLSWERDGKDLVKTLDERKVREELAEYDSLMVRIIQEAKALGNEIARRYETDAKN